VSQTIPSAPSLCKDSLALSINILVNSLHSFCINFVWVPGHAGIANNEIADHYAKEACTSSKSKLFPISELFSLIRQSTLDDWKRSYPTTFNSPSSHFLSVQAQLPPYPWYKHFSDIRGSLIIKLSRLRFGHNHFPPHLKRSNLASSDNSPLHPDSPAQVDLNHFFFFSSFQPTKIVLYRNLTWSPHPSYSECSAFVLQLSHLSSPSRFSF